MSMSESAQAVFGLVVIVGMMGSVFAYPTDRGSWAPFVATVSITIGSLGILLWSLFRRDKAPDHLKSLPGGLFERDGFCFKLMTRPKKGRCYVDLYFQSRYDRPSHAMVVLQPSRGFFLARPDLSTMTIEVDCPAGGHGVTSVPWSVGKKFQGKAQSLDVAADVFYPGGKGAMIRYRGGVQVGTAGFDTWNAVLTVAGAMGGMIVLKTKAKATLGLPTDVEESVADDLSITTTILWNLGDAPDHPPIKQRSGLDPNRRPSAMP